LLGNPAPAFRARPRITFAVTPEPARHADSGPRPLTLGPVELETNLLLAPIAGYCDLAFRLTCRDFDRDPHAAPGRSGATAGLGLACTDLLSPQGLLRGTATSLDLAKTNHADKPIGMQLYGGDPATMAEGAIWAADHGATVVDINMGCPVDKITKKDGGSRLMVPDEGPAASSCRSFGLALRIVEAVRAALPDHVPLTAKMRLGWSLPDDAPKLACALIDAGVVGVTVHGRTTEQRFRGEADWSRIADVVDAVHAKTASLPGGPTPVIGNGDVREAADAARMIRETRCDGVMIGRGALAAPWIFRDAWSLISTGALPPPIPQRERVETIRRYFERTREHRGERFAMFQIRRRISWLAKRLGEPGESVKPFKEAIRTAPGPADVHAALDAFQGGGLRATTAIPGARRRATALATTP